MELFVDGVSKGTSTGDKSVTVSTGSHTVRGRTTLGSYVAETKDYTVNVTSGGVTTQVWWDRISITVKYNGVTQNGGYTLKVNNPKPDQPVRSHIGGRRKVKYPISCTWTATGETKTGDPISYSPVGFRTGHSSFLNRHPL